MELSVFLISVSWMRAAPLFRTHAQTHTHTHTHTTRVHTRTHTHAHAHTRARTHTHTNTHYTHAHTHTHTHTHYTCARARAHTHTHTHTHKHTQAHTHTHTTHTWDEYGSCRIPGRLSYTYTYFLDGTSFEYGAKGSNSVPRYLSSQWVRYLLNYTLFTDRRTQDEHDFDFTVVSHVQYYSPLRVSQLLWVRKVALPRSRATQSLVVYLGHLVSGGHKYRELVLQVRVWARDWQPLTVKVTRHETRRIWHEAKARYSAVVYTSVSQPPGCGPVPGPCINYTGPREVLLEFVILFF